MYIINHTLEVDSETGLNKELRFVNLSIDSELKIISVTYTVSLVSPTGVVMKELERNIYKRDSVNYERLEQSPIGDGIKQLLAGDIQYYPNF